jgi:hypothetical protein
MSYSFNLTVTYEDVPDLSDSIRREFHRSSLSSQAEHGTSFESINAVEDAAIAAGFMTDALGHNWKTARIMVSGHANPNNSPREGWSNEYLTVTVSVLEYVT